MCSLRLLLLFLVSHLPCLRTLQIQKFVKQIAKQTVKKKKRKIQATPTRLYIQKNHADSVIRIQN